MKKHTRPQKGSKRIGWVLLLSVSVQVLLPIQPLFAAKSEKEIVLRIDSSLASIDRKLVPISPEDATAVPFLEQDTTFVPLRFVSEALGAKVEWEQATQTVTMATYDRQILFAVGSRQITVNGQDHVLSVHSILRNNVTFVPLRGIAESLGSHVEYEDGFIRISGRQTPSSSSGTAPEAPIEKNTALKEGMSYRVYQHAHFLDGFATRQEAVSFAKQYANATVKNRKDEVVWDSFPPYRVYQSEKFLAYYDSYADAVSHAKKYANSFVTYKTAAKPIWTFGGPSKQPVYINVPLIRQLPELPRGCEVTALASLLQFAGVPVDKMTLAAEIRKDPTPYSEKNGVISFGSPHRGFVGDMYSFNNPGFGVYHGPVFELAERYLPERVVDLTGTEFEDVLHFVGTGTPVWIISNVTFRKLEPYHFQTWMTPDGPIWVTKKEHSVVIVGYDEDYIYIRDPHNKTGRVAKQPFKEAWEQMGRQAISLLPEV
ncbi:C39 family peptidase [Paenibacillus chitinolyticus]|uniref:C39 family peptidase n=1 Tax=Paenibacillus chitinolyticus TaxID=79263 RepID=UPI0036DE44C5